MKEKGNKGAAVHQIRVAKIEAEGSEIEGICLSCGEETNYDNYCSGCDAWICNRCRGGFRKVAPGPHTPDDHPGSPYAVHVMNNGRLH